jgi:hypothetical protein
MNNKITEFETDREERDHFSRIVQSFKAYE